MRPNILFSPATIVLGVVLAFADLAGGEFYRYVTDDGAVHFVDDLSKVPEQYLPKIRVYEERTDGLSEDEKALLLQRERELDDQREMLEKRQLEEQEQEALRKRLETDVIINGNQVIVPVTLKNGTREVEALMLLDTGASHLVLFDELARKLAVQPRRKSVSMVAGGSLIDSELTLLERVAVGPLNLSQVQATVIQHELQTGGPVRFDGLLGMNVLRNMPYTIDFENRKIRWSPP
jgi:predicted aspartyl protease